MNLCKSQILLVGDEQLAGNILLAKSSGAQAAQQLKQLEEHALAALAQKRELDRVLRQEKEARKAQAAQRDRNQEQYAAQYQQNQNQRAQYQQNRNQRQ